MIIMLQHAAYEARTASVAVVPDLVALFREAVLVLERDHDRDPEVGLGSVEDLGPDTVRDLHQRQGMVARSPLAVACSPLAVACSPLAVVCSPWGGVR